MVSIFALWFSLFWTSEPIVIIEETPIAIIEVVEEPLYSARQLKNLGVIYWGNWRWTWYSQRVLPGGGLKIPGRHVDSQGYVCDEEDYICAASSTLARGTVIETPFGKPAKIYDCGCAADTIDIYTDF